MHEMGSQRPLLDPAFETDGVSLFVPHLAHLVHASDAGQIAMRELLEASLRRIARDPSGHACAVSPWLDDPREPHVVELDPRRAFGRLVLKDTRVRIDILADRHRAGDPVEFLARDYSLTMEQVHMALQWAPGT
jgi:uncharacterized protein (DUF433 family)